MQSRCTILLVTLLALVAFRVEADDDAEVIPFGDETFEDPLTHDCELRLLGEFNPRPDFMGMIWLTDGRGNVRGKLIHPHPRTNDSQPVLDRVTAAAKKLKRPTIFYLITHDNDVWDKFAREEVRMHPLKIQSVLLRCPMIFFLAWNPTVDNDGRVGPHTIPIPDFEIFKEVHTARAPEVADRRGVVNWRGTTTGMWFDGTYAKSDRYRMVKELLGAEGTDVKFSARVQDVPSDVVTDEMLGGKMEHKTMLASKVIIDVDGNANAWEGLRWKLLAGGTVVKIASSRHCIQWYYPHLISGVHFQYYEFGKGSLAKTIQALADNSSLMKEMSANAYDFGQKYLTKEAASAYLENVIVNVHDLAESYRLKDWRPDADANGIKKRKEASRCTSRDNGKILSSESGAFLSSGAIDEFHNGEHCSFTVICPVGYRSVSLNWRSRGTTAGNHLKVMDRKGEDKQTLVDIQSVGTFTSRVPAAAISVQFDSSPEGDRAGFELHYMCLGKQKLGVVGTGGGSAEAGSGPYANYVLLIAPLSVVGLILAFGFVGGRPKRRAPRNV